MKTKTATEAAAPEPRHDKDNHFVSQYQTFYQFFKERPKTMLQVSIETGILRANICRYIAGVNSTESPKALTIL
jgi:hypothetical protein